MSDATSGKVGINRGPIAEVIEEWFFMFIFGSIISLGHFNEDYAKTSKVKPVWPDLIVHIGKIN